MQIGITIDNKLVYDKEIKINKKVVKTGVTIASAGILTLLVTMSIMQPVVAYPLTANNLGSVYEATQLSIENTQVISEVFTHTSKINDVRAFVNYNLEHFINGSFKATMDVLSSFKHSCPTFNMNSANKLLNVSDPIYTDLVKGIVKLLSC